jgi:4-hydroxybenzoyl-CoA reductase subunit beta
VPRRPTARRQVAEHGEADVLRLPPFRYHRPGSVAEAIALMGEHAGDAMYIAGGTDLVPNMKHRLFEPGHLIALKGIDGLRGIREEDGHLRIGAAETLSVVAGDEAVRTRFPALADAAGHVAGPQLRNSGTIGGNVCLDTRCTYYNQTPFWRGALGYCLKKDGDVCHVTKVGKKCVAAHSADTPPVLMTLDAVAVLVGPDGTREVPVRDFFVTDGIVNTQRAPEEIVAEIRIPLEAASRRQGYAKLRQRKSIDFPLLTVAVAAELEGDGTVHGLEGVVTALGSRPRVLSAWGEIAEGRALDDEVVEELAERAFKQCHPLENIIVDPEWRRAMVPVYVKRALEQVAAA